MTWTQKKEVIRDTNEVGLVLLEFYYSKAGLWDYGYADDKVAYALDWSITKVRDNRIKLEKTGYFHKVVVRGRKDTSTIISLGHKRWDKSK